MKRKKRNLWELQVSAVICFMRKTGFKQFLADCELQVPGFPDV